MDAPGQLLEGFVSFFVVFVKGLSPGYLKLLTTGFDGFAAKAYESDLVEDEFFSLLGECMEGCSFDIEFSVRGAVPNAHGLSPFLADMLDSEMHKWESQT